MTAIYTHVGRRAYTGHYAVTADAFRNPGRTHAFNLPVGTNTHAGAFRALCGEVVSAWSDDHFKQDEPQVVPATPGHRVTCKRCQRAIRKAEKAAKV